MTTSFTDHEYSSVNPVPVSVCPQPEAARIPAAGDPSSAVVDRVETTLDHLESLSELLDFDPAYHLPAAEGRP